MTEVVVQALADPEGIAPPGHGMVTVVEIEMVVAGPTGATGAGVAGAAAGEETGGCWGELASETTGAEEAGAETAGLLAGCCGEFGVVAGAVGTKVMVDGTPVTIPGLAAT